MRFTGLHAALVFGVSGGIFGIASPGCGGDEMFVPQLATTERLIDSEAFARLTKDDQGVGELIVVGDLDGDGIDDAVIRTDWSMQLQSNVSYFGSSVYVLYGGKQVSGEIDLATLPMLTDVGAAGATVEPAGDVDGDGLADFLVGVARPFNCELVAAQVSPYSGAHIVYGSRTRLAGATSIASAGAFLRDSTPCESASSIAGLGDVDGDGKADFAIGRAEPVGVVPTSPSEVFVFYGGKRLSGVVDLDAADAVIQSTAPLGDELPGVARLGDIDGDGYSDFVVQVAGVTPSLPEVRLVRGGATRLAGSVALTDVAQTHLLDAERCQFLRRFAFALGDLDGDGRDDFAVASCHDGTDDAPPLVQRLYYGRAGLATQLAASDADATLVLTGVTGSNAAAADLDGDGRRDLIVGDASLHGSNGGVHVIRGNGTRLSGVFDPATRAVTYVGQPVRGPLCKYVGWSDCIAHEEVGQQVVVGDLTGSGRPVMLIDAPTDQLEFPEPGVHGSSVSRAYLVSLPASANP